MRLSNFLNATQDDLWRLNASDLNFLWGKCHRCFYLKYVYKIYPPSMQMPAIFNNIDRFMKSFFQNKDLADVSGKLPRGVVGYSDTKIVSQPIQIGNHAKQCVIAGIVDGVLTHSDGTYTVIDYKTAEPDAEHTAMYKTQLSSYSWAFEHPADGSLHLEPINNLGLLVYKPMELTINSSLVVDYKGSLSWIDLGKDDDSFMGLIDEILDVLESPTPPEPTPTCDWCKYQAKLKENNI